MPSSRLRDEEEKICNGEKPDKESTH